MAGECEEPEKSHRSNTTNIDIYFVLLNYMFDVTVLYLICYAVHFLSSFCARLAVSRRCSRLVMLAFSTFRRATAVVLLPSPPTLHIFRIVHGILLFVY